MKDICAVIVTYNPKPQEVQTLIERIAEHVGLVVIVDNGSRNIGALLRLPVTLIELGGNKGVATAQNVGIRAALELDYKFVILFDQDSLPELGMVAKLRNAFDDLTAQGVRVAALGPNYRERNDGFLKHEDTNAKYVRETMIISSGCLMPAEALRDVGPMKDDLFIDHIDVEWCRRATMKNRVHRRMETAHGWKIYVVADAYMGHSLGDGSVQFMSRRLHFAGPLRFYYGYRNSVHLYFQDFPLRWKIADARYRIVCMGLAILGIYPGGRLKHVGMMLRGIWDGLFGHLGPYRSSEESHAQLDENVRPNRF